MAYDPAASYEEIPYSDACFSLTHPDHLAVMASLYGLTPPPVERCRVLELGCALGGNLIPMALGLPDAQFVGIDLAANQIAAAQETAQALGLRNLDLRTMSITDFGPDLGRFDYILCHGVYSWVPTVVQDKILAICAENLTPSGVAYISFNTYPGWHARGLVREMMSYHVRRTTEARARVQEARQFLEQLAQAVIDKESSYARILRTEAEYLRQSGDHYLFHEHLEETNQPCYYHEFATRAAEKGLRYFSEARDGQAENLSPEARESLEQWSEDPIERQQYLDFLCNRTFRLALLCHEEAGASWIPTPDAVAKLTIRATARPTSERPDIHSDVAVKFRIDGGATVATNHPLLKTALLILCEVWPEAISLDALRAAVKARLAEKPTPADTPGNESQDLLPAALTRCFLSGLVGLHAHPPNFAAGPGERPVASPVARLQVARGGEKIATLRHRSITLRDFDRSVLSLLDGRRDRASILAGLVQMAVDEVFTISQDDRPIRDPSILRELFTEELEPSLRRIAGHALLIEA